MRPVLFVTRNFPPLVGGMERLALEAARAIASEAPVIVVGPRGCESWAPGHAVGVAYRSAGRFLMESLLAARRLAAREQPAWVMGGSGLAAPPVVTAARRAGARSACFVHGLDLVVDSPAYRVLCLPALRRIDLVIANSRNTERLAAEAGIDPERVRLLHPGVATGERASPNAFLARHPAAAGRPLLAFVGRLLRRKGVVELVRRVLPDVVARHRQVLLVVAGDDAGDALAGQADEARRLGDTIAACGLADNVLCTGHLDDEALRGLYSAAALMVFPVRDLPDDVEGFGMVALEAAAHGLPTVAFNAGGVADALADGVSGYLIPAGDYSTMAARIARCLDGDHDGVTPNSCRDFAAGFAWPAFGARLRGLLIEH